MLKNKFLLIATFLTICTSISAQWTCRSKIAGNMKPFRENSKLMWAGETTSGVGMMNDRYLLNAIQFFAFSYTSKSHDFYIDGGFKHWTNRQGSQKFWKNRPGLRELFHRYQKGKFNITTGLQTINMGDHFLVNERAWGISSSYKKGELSYKFSAATVTKDFAKMGTFCSVRYLYDIPGRWYPNMGNGFGETNFVGGTLLWTPSWKKKSKKSESADEFEEFDEFTSEEFEKPKKHFLKKAGLVFYDEFGNGFAENKLFLGLMAEFELPFEFMFQPEILHMNSENDALIYMLRLRKVHIWPKGNRTMFTAQYLDKYELSDHKSLGPSYSNLFMGEVFRMDSHDMPVGLIALKHNFPKIRLHVKLQAAQQFQGENMQEFNLAVGKTFFKSLKLTAMFSKFNADIENIPSYLARLEIRLTF